MKYRIQHIRTLRNTTLLHLDVVFLDAANNPVHYNDFVMRIPPTRRRYTGQTGPGGQILDPGAYTITTTNAAALIRANIEAYITRLDLKTAHIDNRDRHLHTTSADPENIIARADVQALIDATLESTP